MEPEPIEYAVDQMAKDLDWLMKVGLKAKKIDIDSITEPQMADLKSRFLSQLPQINGDPPGSPLQTTVSGGSHKSDDEMSAFSDDPRQMGDRTEIPLVSGLAEDVAIRGGLSLKVRTDDQWTGACYRVDRNLHENRINTNILEENGLDKEAKDGFIEVVVCFRHSTKEQTCRMRICEAADFKNAGCNILFGTDMIPSWSNSVESETIGNGSFGLVNGQLEHLISMTDLVKDFEPDRRPPIQYGLSYSSSSSSEDAMRLAINAAKLHGGTCAEQACFASELLRNLFLPQLSQREYQAGLMHPQQHRRRSHPPAGVQNRR